MRFHALAVLGYLSGLLIGSPRNLFTREEVLKLINAVRNDPELFDPDLVRFHDEIDRGLSLYEGERQDGGH
jgi:hypothetical protein